LATLTEDLSAAWVLDLLDHYPSADRIARARLQTLQKIPYISPELAQQVQLAAQQSVASLRGEVTEALLRDLVAQVRHAQQGEKDLRRLLRVAFAALPASGHLQMLTVPGIGTGTAAVLVAKVGSLDHFATAAKFVGYFGVFPEENTSGVDKYGKPVPPGTMCMSRKGNDLVRSFLWNAACSAITHNPAVRALYHRLKARGVRGDVALGHCMRKLLHLAFAVWKTNRPFDPNHYPWASGAEEPRAPANAVPTVAQPNPSGQEKAVGHTRESPAAEVVTTAGGTVEPPPELVKGPGEGSEPRPRRPHVDFAWVRQQVSMEQVLERLGVLGQLRGRGQQRRGPCPIHGGGADPAPTFSVHLGKKAFQCFQADCGAHGNVLDLWAAVRHLSLYEAAVDLVETFGLRRNREEEPVREPVAGGPSGSGTEAVKERGRGDS
jgi:hypothetical protein